MSPSPNSSHVDLTSEQADSLLAPPSTLQTRSFSIDDTRSHLKRYYTQLPASEKGQARAEDSLRTTRFSLSPWLLEILSLSLALAAIAVLIALLALYDKQHNPPWAADISLNTIVSIASVLFRASVMVPITKCISQLSWIWLAKTERPLEDVALFDQASRGVLGGLTILASPRHVTSAVSIGAILTVIMVAVGPCFQQTVAYYSAQVVDDTSAAYTSAAFGYNGSAGFFGGSYGNQGAQLPFNMKSAIYTGLLSSGMVTRPDPLFSCASGNCTWDAFDTLAVEVECINNLDFFKLQCYPDPNPEPYRGTRCAIEWNKTTSQYRSGSPSRLVNYAPFNWSTSRTTPFFLGLYYANWTSDLDASVWTLPPSGRLDIGWIRATDLYSSNDGSWRDISEDSPLESGMCKLYTVLHTLSASVENGVYKEEIDQVSRNTEESLGYINFKYQNGSSPPVKISITGQHNMVLLQGASNLIESGNVSLAMYDSLVGSEILKMLYQSRNITESMHSLVHYMNIALRSNDSVLHSQEQGEDMSTRSPVYIAPTHRVKGKVYIEKLHVAVRWRWLTLPALVALWTGILLVVTIIQSHSQRVGIWKDSALALVLRSELYPERQRNSAPANTVGAVEREAKGLDVDLSRFSLLYSQIRFIQRTSRDPLVACSSDKPCFCVQETAIALHTR